MTPSLEQRLSAPDIVRGVAVLGILLLNIVSFAMPDAAYFNPRAYGGWHGADLAAYLVNFLLFDGKMRGLFSFLFGASLLIVCERAEARGGSALRVHFPRMAWLLVFGLAHLWLVWGGDILTHYALVGMIAFWFRRLDVARLCALGAILVLFGTLHFAAIAHSAWLLTTLPPDPAHARALAELVNAFGTPPPEAIAAELARHHGGWWPQVQHRVATMGLSPFSLLLLYGWETLGYMLFGMAALRTGLLAGRWPAARLRRWWLRCWAVALPAYLLMAAHLVIARFSLFAVTLSSAALPGLVRPAMILGWACLILLLVRPESPIGRRLAAAGRMAFSNYIATSLLCVLLFDGLGLFGRLSRWQLYPVVFFAWALMLLWSPAWLRHFRYGPMEWLWRSLARHSLQPIRNSLANRSQ